MVKMVYMTKELEDPIRKKSLVKLNKLWVGVNERLPREGDSIVFVTMIDTYSHFNNMTRVDIAWLSQHAKKWILLS